MRIITDDDQSEMPGSDIVRLQQRGLHVMLDRNQAHMHHKFAIVDQVILVSGSYNWTLSAAVANMDNILVTSDQVLVDRFRQHFEELWSFLGG